jgi:alpha-L-arabinofuranosidase
MFSMAFEPTRRRFTRSASLARPLPGGLVGNTFGSKKAVIHDGQEIGVVGPVFHSHFAEHPGSSVNGGIWVGQKSAIPNIDGFQKAAVDALKESGVPALRWPGGCFADLHHRRDGIGSREKRSMSVSRQGSGVIVTQFDPRRDVDIDLDCSLGGVTAKEGRPQVLREFDINSHNSFEQPDRLVTNPHSVAVEGSRFRITLQALLSDGRPAACLEVKPS